MSGSRRLGKIFLWVFGILVALIGALILLSVWSPDRPFSYIGL